MSEFPYDFAFALAYARSIAPRPTAADVISYSITEAQQRGEVFDPWTPEGDAAFRNRRRTLEAP